MIDRPALIAWRAKAPWPDRVQIEQDLLLSRLMIEIARDQTLGAELAMRGGTCLHKLHLPTALRYSEDLDYVRSTKTGIKPYTHAIARIAEKVGLTVASRQRSGQMVHVYLDGQPTEGIGRIRIKIEMNVTETNSFQPRTTLPHTVTTSWWSGEADIPTFEPEEMLATKLRALYQRSKGRDLYLDALLTNTPADYTADDAATLIMRELGSRLRNAPLLDEIETPFIADS